MRGLLQATTVVLAACLLTGCASEPVSNVTDRGETPTPAATAPAPGASAGSPSRGGPTPGVDAPSSAPASPAATPGEPPPKPGDPTFTLSRQTLNADGTVTEEHTITWTSPDGAASAFLLYGLTDCLRYSAEFNGQPCVVRGMRIPKELQVLIGQVPGDARSMTVTWELGEIGPPPYWSILIRATGPGGDSIFTIVHSEDVCFECVY